jgi:hypothetical protein
MASRTLATILIACAAIPSLGFQSQSRRWPTIQPLQAVFSIQDPDKAVIKTYIRDSKDTPLYLFVCRTGEDNSIPDIVYSNDLDCRLLPALLGEIEDNLLVEEPNEKAWFSRGHMVAQQLYGLCGSYPEYGLVRHFRLRGMRLTIEFFDVKFATMPPPLEGSPSSRLSSYKLRLSVERDRFAKREIAERGGYLDPLRVGQTPPRSCSKIRRGIDK